MTEVKKVRCWITGVKPPVKENQPYILSLIAEDYKTRLHDGKTWDRTLGTEIQERLEVSEAILTELEVKEEQFNNYTYYRILSAIFLKEKKKETSTTYQRIAETSFETTIKLIEKHKDKLNELNIDPTEVFRVVYGTMTIQANKETMMKKLRERT